ncbi:MAG: DUF5060 domain-containing protein [Anaerolineae bacterium]|nr:DUF5060 domain-containing protein [Anaerolineae bacterium]
MSGQKRESGGRVVRVMVVGLALAAGLLAGLPHGAFAQGSPTPTPGPLTFLSLTPGDDDQPPPQAATRTPAQAAATRTPTPSPTPSPSPSSSAAAQSQSYRQYGLVEFELPTTGISEQASVIAEFRGPDGSSVTLPGFWMQPQRQTCNQECAVELIDPVGDPVWRIRFSPALAGRYTYRVDVADGGQTRTAAQGAFTVEAAAGGPVRVGPNPRYFERADGTAFFPVGVNLGWSWTGGRGTRGYQDWLRRLSEVGANYARLYVDVPWFIGLGWREPVNAIAAFQADAWRLDAILQTAEQYGIALQIVLVWHQGWGAYGGLPVIPPGDPPRPNTAADWFSNPHNVQLGGPFQSAAEYFSSPAGRDLFKARLRYAIARWGYSSSLFAWELVDQADRIAPEDPTIITAWLQEMVAYARQIDPYRHLITSGVRDTARLSLLDSVVLDFREVRFYQRVPIEPAGDQVLGALNLLAPLIQTGDRPVLINEFSVGPWFEPAQEDPLGTHLVTTMWASALAGSGGAAASWWWDTYLFPRNLVEYLAPLSAFSRGVPWNTANLQSVSLGLTGDETLTYQPMRVSGFNETFGYMRPADTVFRITADAMLPPASSVPAYLYGTVYSTQFGQPQTFIITPPTDTRLLINVSRTSDRGEARLAVIVNDQPVAEMQLNPNSTATTLIVPLRAGENRVVLDNLGADYLILDSLEIEAYISPLRTLALADREEGILLAWLQHRDYTWQNAAAGVQAQAVSAAIRVDGMPVGQYLVELWDPFTGNVLGQETASVSGVTEGDVQGMLSVQLLPISRMLAVRAIRVSEPANLPSPTPTFTPTPRLTATPSS